MPERLTGSPEEGMHINQHFAFTGVVEPKSGKTLTMYGEIIKKPALMKVWLAAISKESGQLAHGFKETKGTNTIPLMDHNKI